MNRYKVAKQLGDGTYGYVSFLLLLSRIRLYRNDLQSFTLLFGPYVS